MQNVYAKHSGFATRLIAKVTQLLQAIEELNGMRSEWDALAYSDPEIGIKQTDLDGTNAHLTPEIIASAFSSLDTLKTAFLSGHATNLNKVRG